MAYPYWYGWYPYPYSWAFMDPFMVFYYWMGMIYYIYLLRMWIELWGKLVETVPKMFPPSAESAVPEQ